MHSNFKDIHIGKIILNLVLEKDLDEDRIVKFLKKATRRNKEDV